MLAPVECLWYLEGRYRIEQVPQVVRLHPEEHVRDNPVETEPALLVQERRPCREEPDCKQQGARHHLPPPRARARIPVQRVVPGGDEECPGAGSTDPDEEGDG